MKVYTEVTMYTTDECGIMNNYAVEPDTYFAEYPSQEQQQRYASQAAFATLLVALVTFVAMSVS